MKRTGIKKMPGSLLCLLLCTLFLASCTGRQEENLLIDDGDIFSSEAFESGEDPAAERESAETESAETDPESFFLDVPDAEEKEMPRFKAYGNFAEDSAYLYFINRAANSDIGIFTAADKATGKLIPLCSKAGCSHADRSCMAYVGMSEWDIIGMGREGKKLLFAKNSSGNSISVHSLDLTRCEYREEGKIDLSKFLEGSKGFGSIMNPKGTFLGDTFYFHMLQTKMIDFRIIEDEISYSGINYRAVVETLGLSDKAEREILLETYDDWDGAMPFILPDGERVYCLLQLYRRDSEQEELLEKNGEENPFVPIDVTLILNVRDPGNGTGTEAYRGETELSLTECTLYDGKIMMLGRADFDPDADRVLAELDPESLKTRKIRTFPKESADESIVFGVDGPIVWSARAETVSGTKLLNFEIHQTNMAGQEVSEGFSELELPFFGAESGALIGSDDTYLYFIFRQYEPEQDHSAVSDRCLCAVPVRGGPALVFGI